MAIKTTRSRVAVSYENEESADEENAAQDDQESDASENMQDDDDDQADNTANAGWADSIAKILKTNKPKGKKTLVLSKAKKLSDLRPKAVDAGYEVQTQDGVIQKEQIEHIVSKDSKPEKLTRKKKDMLGIRKKPNILEKDRERTLSKIATRGVVQLFNAVKKQQKDIDVKLKDAGSLEVRRDKVLKNIDKREFLKVLRGDNHSTNNPLPQNQVSASKQKEGEQIWSVLRDDFMMGAKMKDWDKELDIENEMEIEKNLESE